MRSRRDFLVIQRTGQRHATRHFLLVHRDESDGPTKLGITVTKKIGPAVLRNRIKRAIREVFRHNRALLGKGCEIVVIVRHGAGALRSAEVAQELAPAFLRVAGRAAPAGA